VAGVEAPKAQKIMPKMMHKTISEREAHDDSGGGERAYNQGQGATEGCQALDFFALTLSGIFLRYCSQGEVGASTGEPVLWLRVGAAGWSLSFPPCSVRVWEPGGW